MVRTRAQGTLDSPSIPVSVPGESFCEPTQSVSVPAASVSIAASVSEAPSSQRSSTKTVLKLALQAEHARRLAELERVAAEKEKVALDLEFQAKLAEINASDQGSRSSSRKSKSNSTGSHASVESWLENNNNCLPNTHHVPQMPLFSTSHMVTEPSGANVGLPATSVTQAQAAVAEAAPTYSLGPYGSRTCTGVKMPAGPSGASCAGRQEGNTSTEGSDGIQVLARAIESLSRSKPRVSQIQLPLFDGKPSDWLIFKRIYEDSKSSYTAVENLARIGSALRGPAREAVAILLVAAHDPDQIIHSLNQRFGRSELILLNEISKIKALPKLGNSESPTEIAEFASKVRNCVETIKLLNQVEYLASPELSNAIIGKLTPALRAQWAHFAYYRSQEIFKLELVAQFLDHEADVRNKFGYMTDCDISKIHATNCHMGMKTSLGSASAKQIKTTSSGANSNECKYCLAKNHEVDDCPKILILSTDERWRWVKENKVCHRCLKKGNHRYSFCKPKNACCVAGCAGKHHKLLHDSVVVNQIKSPPNDDGSSSSHDITGDLHNNENDCDNHLNKIADQEVVTHSSSSSGFSSTSLRPLLKVVPVTISGPKGSLDTFALLDDGSTGTFIDAKASEAIGAHGPLANLRMDCINGMSKETEVQFVDFDIKGKHCCESYQVQNARSIKNLNLHSSHSITAEDLKSYSHLADLCNVLPYAKAVPTLLIGIDNWHLIISKETRQGKRSQPVASRTALGWVLFGFASSRTKTVNLINHCTTSKPDDISVIIQNYYKLDSIGITKLVPRSSQDERAVKILENTARRLPSGRFEVGLLWCNDNLEVPKGSYNLAWNRLKSLERKFVKDPPYQQHYRRNIQDAIDKGYAEPCSSNSNSFVTWYLPHFGVTNPNKPGKLRVVHDAAAKCDDVSLNSMLLAGPDLLQPILDILFRFREGRISLSADIREMFPQIKIRVEDRDAQRFLWRSSPESPVTCFRMSSMIFGAASSPFTALYIKNKNALEYQNKYPDAVDAILNNHYMDDYLGSLDNIEEAAKITRDIVFIHKQACLEMRGWVSNEPAALKLIPSDLRHQQNSEVSLGSFPENVRTLGLIWHPATDTIGFNISSAITIPDKITKRAVLSQLMRVFDPLGLLSPLTIRGRILFQNAWRKGLDWDQELPAGDCHKWKQWFSDILAVSNLKIPRWYLCKSFPSSRELHLFCDSSENAYAAVAYWRFIFPDGSVKISLICSKARVTPLKPVSIPRLELQAALIAARLAATIVNAVIHKPDSRFFWCDSKNVLCWLRNDARNFKPFVAHRIGEIAEITSLSEWRWVPSTCNVADDATRLSSVPLAVGDRWFQGPDFLLLPSGDWPSELQCDENVSIPELKCNANTVYYNETAARIQVPIVADCSRFSSWLRFLRSTALAHKYIRLLRLRVIRNKNIDVRRIVWLNNSLVSYELCEAGNLSPTSTNLSADDLELARLHVFRLCQFDSFEQELKSLRSNAPLPRDSKLRNVKIVLDRDGLIHIAGRIDVTRDVGDSVKRPIVLDGKHRIVHLLILHYHQQAAHANCEMILNEMRQKYYIFRLRSVIKSVAHQCQFCKIRKASPMSPPTGDLPLSRLAHHLRPFSFTGIDYFGPVIVSVGRRSEKRYVALFTCLTTRALHLEVVHSLSADSAVMALRRFVARRGTPSEMWSDNGTAFVGATKELRELYGTSLSAHVANSGIKWRFIPPGAPFMGGAWERLVRSVKTALKVTLKEHKPKDELLLTVLAEAEALINSRPLTYVASEDSEEALSPNHFLLGSSSGAPAAISLTDRNLLGRSDWKKALRLSDHFWKRWLQEYLPTLLPKRPTSTGQPNLKVGDVVIIVDSNLPRGSWPKGRITCVYPGKDGSVRVAEVQTAAGLFKRPAKKIVRLPVD